MGTPGPENDRHRCTLLPHQHSDNPLRPISFFGEIGDFLGRRNYTWLQCPLIIYTDLNGLICKITTV